MASLRDPLALSMEYSKVITLFEWNLIVTNTHVRTVFDQLWVSGLFVDDYPQPERLSLVRDWYPPEMTYLGELLESIGRSRK
jgi:hypothetical protein